MESQESRDAKNKAGSEEEESESSPDIQLGFLKNARELMVMDRKCRDAKRKSIQEEHAKRTKEVEEKINGAFNDRKTRVTKIQKAQWERLAALNKKRCSLEGQILGSMKSIGQHTINICNELSAMLDGRKDDALDSKAV